MSTMLFSVLAATALATAGVAAPVDTRAEDPSPTAHLAVAHTAVTGGLRSVNRMADGQGPGWDNSNRALCDEHHWHWSDKDGHCHNRLRSLPLALIGAGATGGFIYALASRDDGGAGGAGGQPISH